MLEMIVAAFSVIIDYSTRFQNLGSFYALVFIPACLVNVYKLHIYHSFFIIWHVALRGRQQRL